jgi:hypothetical protein
MLLLMDRLKLRVLEWWTRLSVFEERKYFRLAMLEWRLFMSELVCVVLPLALVILKMLRLRLCLWLRVRL